MINRYNCIYKTSIFKGEIMQKHAIIGAGAVGSILYYLLKDNHEIDIDIYAKEARKLYITKNDKPIETKKITKILPTKTQYDTIYICVKATATKTIIEDVLNMCHDQTNIIICQNGISQVDLFNHPYTYHAVVYISGQKKNDEVIYYQDNTLILPDVDKLITLKQYTDLSQLNIVLDENHQEKQWFKLLVNLGINTITALTKNTAQVLEQKQIESLTEQLLAEGCTVARRHGIALGDDTIENIMAIYKTYHPLMGTSMYYDVYENRLTEFEYIQGYIHQLASSYQLHTPILNTVTALLAGYQYKRK